MSEEPYPESDWGLPPQLEIVKGLRAYTRELEEARMEAKRVGQEYAEAKRTFRLAWARAHLKTQGQGTVKDREAMVVLEVEEEQFAVDVKEQELRACHDRIKILQTKISGGQTMHKGVLTEMQMAGMDGQP